MIEELIHLAKEMREANARGEKLGLTDDELAFYDALETNDSAVKILGDEALRTIACELVSTVRNNITIDWTLRESVCAQLSGTFCSAGMASENAGGSRFISFRPRRKLQYLVYRTGDAAQERRYR